MVKRRRKGSMDSFVDHLGPGKEDQLNALKTEISNKMKRMLELTRGINPGNKNVNMKRKGELITLVEYLNQLYVSLYSSYEDLRGEVKKVYSGDDASSATSASSSSSDSESFHALKVKSIENTADPVDSDSDNQDVESKILKDKLPSTSNVKRKHHRDSRSAKLAIDQELLSLKHDIVSLSSQKSQLEEQVESKSSENMQLKERISSLESQILEVEATSEQNVQMHVARISDLEAQSNSLLLQKEELELKLQKEAEETSKCLNQVETLRKQLTSRCLDEKAKVVEKEELKFQLKDLEVEIHSITSNKSDLEEQIKRINHETFQSNIEKEEKLRKISELQILLSERENDILTEQHKLKACINANTTLTDQFKALENQAEALQNELESSEKEKEWLKIELEKLKDDSSVRKTQMEEKNTELTNKIAEQQDVLLELGDTMNKLKEKNRQAQSKHFQLVDRKIEEIAEEFRKKFEDKYKILSRRIRVAEQLHGENKEWYKRTKHRYEQENRELKESLELLQVGMSNVKGISLKANDVLTSLDSVALKFEECNANFLNRISKASCELKFAKDWAMRKNKAVVNVKNDIDCLLPQLDAKEAEVLVFREKVWKSENKVRELEKVIEEKEDGMLALKEEKREAIRQLCVWIDYNRSRSDYYRKTLIEMNPGLRRVS